ncbi:hypothetical protein ABZX82_02305 [Streptomyces griseoflavus]|uniref:hypothetical protein n=1 Tax=Streptomyces griseoflavus TaxID=35619 RepID=UPI0033A0BD6D
MSDWLADYLHWKDETTAPWTPPDSEDAQHAAAAVDDGLDRLFRRLGPPTERATEK